MEKLISVRDQIAKANGFENYFEYAMLYTASVSMAKFMLYDENLYFLDRMQFNSIQAGDAVGRS